MLSINYFSTQFQLQVFDMIANVLININNNTISDDIIMKFKCHNISVGFLLFLPHRLNSVNVSHTNNINNINDKLY